MGNHIVNIGRTTDGAEPISAPPTWASIAAQVPDLVEEDREALRRLTAPARHAWRVQKTIAAAAATPGRPCRGMQAALIALDLHGTGGTAGCGAGASETSTLRAPWARGLGKGRWQAGDGRAWRAAAEEALCQLVTAELETRRSICAALRLPPYAASTSDADWLAQRGCGLLDSPWAQGCTGLPVVSASAIFSVLLDADVTVAQQARGYALHRLADRVARGEPLVSDGAETSWTDVVRVARERLW